MLFLWSLLFLLQIGCFPSSQSHFFQPFCRQFLILYCRIIAFKMWRHIFINWSLIAIFHIDIMILLSFSSCFLKYPCIFLLISLRGKCPNMEFFLVRMRENMDQKKLRIWTLFMQCFKWGRKKVSMLLYKIIFFWLFSIFILGIYPSPPTHPHPASTSPTCFMVSPSV